MEQVINEMNMDKEIDKPFSVSLSFNDHMRDLGEAVMNTRVVRALDIAAASYPIHRQVRCAARRPMEQVFDDLALKSGLAAQRLYAGSLLLDGPGVFVQVNGYRKLTYCSCTFKLWARDIALAEATIAKLFRVVGDDRVRSQLFVVEWRMRDRDGDAASATFEEVADDVLVDEAYPMLAEPVDQFIDRYVQAPESVLILLGPPGTGKTRLVRAILGAMSRRKGDSAEVLYTADKQVLRSDSIFVDFVTGSHDAFVIEDADYLLQSRTDGNADLHRFLMVADGVVRTEGRKLLFTTNVPNAGAIDEALLRPGRCFAAVTVRRLTRDEGHRLALRLCDGDAARASRVLASAMQTDQRTVSAAEVYQAMRQPPQPVAQSMPPRVRATA